MKIKITVSNKQLFGLVLVLIVVSSVGYVYSAAPNPGHTWNEIGDVPAGFADNIDNDLLAGISCSNGQVLKYNNGWNCGTDIDTNTDYCSGGACSGSLTISNNLVANNNERDSCSWYGGGNPPNGEWSYYECPDGKYMAGIGVLPDASKGHIWAVKYLCCEL